MKENTQLFWHIMLYYFKKGKNATEMQKKICAVYGEGAVTDQMCQSGLKSLCLGRSVAVDSDRIETLIENNQCSTMRQIANILKIPKSIMLLVKMKSMFFLFYGKTPHDLFGQPNTKVNIIEHSLCATLCLGFPIETLQQLSE